MNRFGIERVGPEWTHELWRLFGEYVPDVFHDVKDIFAFHQVLIGWNVWVVYKASVSSSSRNICGLGFISRTGGAVKMFHPCILPSSLRHSKEMIKQCLDEGATRCEARWVLTQVRDPRVGRLAETCGFEWAGRVPCDIGGMIEMVDLYTKEIQNGIG